LFSNTDRDWEYYGKNDPYYGVFTHKDFRSNTLDEETIARFFQSGDEYVGQVIDAVHGYFGTDFTPRKVLDFGCGVGRLIVPFAKRYESVTGIDISTSMIAEAKKNCHKFGLSNVIFIQSDDQLSRLSETFDLIHSYIVFQHIPVRRGEIIFRRLLSALNPGGVGVLHFSYSCSFWRRILDVLPFAYILSSIYKGRPIKDRPIQMNQYNLSSLFSILQDAGYQNVHVSFTKHDITNDGVTLFFQKK
jgi:2-polyprenyl-3-methyl-5-hydroxy-6-metoxy-1,4-benzoquinol methylase